MTSLLTLDFHAWAFLSFPSPELGLLSMGPNLLGALGPDWLITWLTPVWILSVGTLLGLGALLVLWLLLAFVSRRGAARIPELIGEGPMLPIFVVACLFATFGLVGSVVVREPVEFLKSVPRFLHTGAHRVSQEVRPTSVGQFFEIPVNFHGTELSRFTISAEQPILLGAFDPQATPKQNYDGMVEMQDNFQWVRTGKGLSLFGEGPIDKLIVANEGTTDVSLVIDYVTEPVYPQAITIPVTAFSLVALFLVYLLQQWLFPKVSAIAHATAKSEMAQPLFAMILMFGAFALIVFIYIPYYTFGEDIKMLKDSGFSTIMVLCIIQAIWGASNSVAEEIEGKTALTVLSKPVGRPQFIFGKFLGIVWSVSVVFIVLGAFFLVLVAYKPVYDARESSALAPVWEECYREVVWTVPGLVLAFMEVVVLTALSVAISSRLPLLANFSICFAIYALGHLTPLIVQSSVGSLAPVAFMGKLIATVFPMLEAFNIQAAIAGGKEVPHIYLFTAFIYCTLYSLAAMLLALVLFEDRDLA